MIRDDLIDFLISKQGQRIAVRFDPTDPVWKDGQKSKLPEGKEVDKNKWLSAIDFLPNNYDKTNYGLSTLISFYATGDLYLITSCLDKFDSPEFLNDEEMMDPYDITYLPPFLEAPYTVHQPSRIIDVGLYNWDYEMAEMLTYSLNIKQQIELGNMKLWKMSPNTGTWRQQVSMTRITAFCEKVQDELDESLENSRLISFVHMYNVMGYPIAIYWDHVAKLAAADYQKQQFVNVNDYSFSKVQDLMIAYTGQGKYYPATKVEMLQDTMILNNKAIAKKKKDPFAKFSKDSWHVYNIPDVNIRTEGEDFLIEQFDDFLMELIKAGN